MSTTTTDTPRTDAFWMNAKYSALNLENRIAGWSDFARQLERELAQANERAKMVSQLAAVQEHQDLLLARATRAEAELHNARAGWHDADLDTTVALLRADNAALRAALEEIERHSDEAITCVEARAALAGTKCEVCDGTGITRSLGRDNDEIIEDCPKCAALSGGKDDGR